MTIRALSSIEKATLLPADQLANLDPSIKPELLAAFDQLTWFPYQGTEVCLANEVIEVRGASTSHFTKYRTRQLTDGQNVGGSELLGVYKLEGAYGINQLKAELALSITYIDDLIKPRTSTLYLLDWDGFYDYAVYGNDDYSKLWTNLSKRSIQSKTQEAVADQVANNPNIELETSSQSKSLLDFGILNEMFNKLKETCGLSVVNKNSIATLDTKVVQVDNKVDGVKEEVHTLKEGLTTVTSNLARYEKEKIEAERWLNFKSFKNKYKLAFTKSANGILTHAVKTEMALRAIEPKLCSNTEYVTYPVDLLCDVCRELKKEQILHFNKDSKGSSWLVESENEVNAKLAKKEWTDPNLGNGYNGVHILPKMLNSMCEDLSKRLKAAFPDRNQYDNNGYCVLYKYIKSEFGYTPNYAKKEYGIEDASGNKVIYNRRHAGVACAFLTKELQKYPEVKSEITKEVDPVFDSKAHLARIKEAEAKRNSDK